MAFSEGPRTCIGKHLALLESKILLVKLLQRYEKVKENQERVITLGIVQSLDNSEVTITKA